MARRKNLTALAALGTLGYMLSKRGDKKDEKSTSDAAERRRAADKEASEEPQSMEKDSGMDPEEAANRRTERMLTNPNAKEFGEAGTSMTVSPSKKPSAAKNPAKPSSGAARNLTASESQAARNALGEGSYRPDTKYSPDRRGVTSETRAPRFTPNEPPVQTHFGPRDEENAPRGSVDVTKLSLAERRNMPSSPRAPTDYRPVNERFRKGGAVKGYASGGTVSSASKRADGIATKGKTRGKIC
jgi:hypothetical protein